MCGICGYVQKELIETSILETMNDTMCHRGPDDSGTWELQQVGYAIGLAQRRLSILDLSELGHQPMLSRHNRFVVTYNGEIYNYIELRQELCDLGYSFISNTDTEVVLAAYEEWGTECFSKFNGMFAIALYDVRNSKLVLARDRIGKKPLYYHYNGKDLVFASELKPIMQYPGFHKEIDYDAVGLYLCNKCIRAPKTIFVDTYKLEPGKYIVYDCMNRSIIQNNYYWDLISVFNSKKKIVLSIEEAKEELLALLRDSIKKRLLADVPVGTFLSAGIDSALVTAIAQEVNGSQIDSFTIGFEDVNRNEAPQAKVIAEYIGTKHHELYMTEEEILGQLRELSRYYDEPFSDSSQLPCMLVSRMARQDVTVVLSGDGGDEAFCGYSMYDYNNIVQRLDWLGNIEYHMPWNSGLCKLLPAYGRAFINNRDCNYKTQLFSDMFEEVANRVLKHRVTGVKNDVESIIHSSNHQEKRMILDMIDYLPSDILTKMDRASMKYSLEVRCPLLDYRILEWSYTVDHRLKYHNREKKFLLKQLAYDYVPRELLNSPKKGFGVPLKRWIRSTLKSEIDSVSGEDFLKRQNIFDYEGIRTIRNLQEKSDSVVYAHIIWGFFVFQMWYKEYIES